MTGHRTRDFREEKRRANQLRKRDEKERRRALVAKVGLIPDGELERAIELTKGIFKTHHVDLPKPQPGIVLKDNPHEEKTYLVELVIRLDKYKLPIPDYLDRFQLCPERQKNKF